MLNSAADLRSALIPVLASDRHVQNGINLEKCTYNIAIEHFHC